MASDPERGGESPTHRGRPGDWPILSLNQRISRFGPRIGARHMPKTTPEHDARVAKMSFAKVYPLYVDKVEKKGRTKAELHEVIEWLTGFDDKTIAAFVDEEVTFETFFARAIWRPEAFETRTARADTPPPPDHSICFRAAACWSTTPGFGSASWRTAYGASSNCSTTSCRSRTAADSATAATTARRGARSDPPSNPANSTDDVSPTSRRSTKSRLGMRRRSWNVRNGPNASNEDARPADHRSPPPPGRGAAESERSRQVIDPESAGNRPRNAVDDGLHHRVRDRGLRPEAANAALRSARS